MEDYEIPDATLKVVARRLNHYMEVQRLEEGFDLSGSSNIIGQFCSGRGLGGTFYYNSLQDKYMDHYLQNPLVRKRLESMGVIHKEMLQEMDKMVKKNHRPKLALIHNSKSSRQRYQQRSENSRLLATTAKVLIQDHSFTRVAGVKTRTSESQSEAISRTDSYSFPQYSPLEHAATPISSYIEQESSSLEGDGEKEGTCGDSGRDYTYSTPPPTPSLHMLTTSSNTSQKSYHTSSSNQESSITPSRESSFMPSQDISSHVNLIMPSHEGAITTSQESPVMPTGPPNATPQILPQASSIPLCYGINPGHALTGMPYASPMYQVNMAYTPLHMLPISMLEQGHTQPVVGVVGGDPSVDIQAYTFPGGQEVGDNTAPRRKFPVVVMTNACVSTKNITDASTQTPVHAETQTDKSAFYELSEKQHKKQVQKKKSVSSKTTTNKGGGVSGLETQAAANSYSQISQQDPSRATRKDTSLYRETSISEKSATKFSAADSYSNEESFSSVSNYSSRRSSSEGKDSSQTEAPLQDESGKLSDDVSCIEKGSSTSELSDSTTRFKLKEDILILPNNDTPTIDYADHKSEYKEFQEAKNSAVETVPLFSLPSVSPSQKGGEIAPKVEGLSTTQETLAGDTPLPSSSSIISSQQPPPHVEKALFSDTPAPLMAAEETEVKNTPVEYPPPPPPTCKPKPLDPITAVKETEVENISPPLPLPTPPVHDKISSVIVATEDEGLPIKEPPLSATSGHSAEVETAKVSTTSVQGLAVNDILLIAEEPIQKNDYADSIPLPLPYQELSTTEMSGKSGSQ